MRKIIKNKKVRYIISFCLIALASISVVQGCKNAMAYPMGSFDFQYDSAKYITMKIDPYKETLFPTGIQEKLGLDMFYGPLEANQFASMLVMLIPFTFFEPITANFLFLIFNLFCTIGSLVLIKILFLKNSNSFYYMCVITFFLIGTPWRNNIGNGQHTIFSFFFFLLCLYLSEKRQIFASGVSLSISFFKYTLTAPMALYLIYKRRIKELIVAGLIHMVLLIGSAVWLKKPLIELLFEPLKKSFGLAKYGSYDISTIFDFGEYGIIVTIVLMVGVMAYTFFANFKGTDEEMISLLTMVSLVVVYHRIYDYFVLIIPFIVILKFKNNNIFEIISKIMISVCICYAFVGQKIVSIIFPTILQYIDYIYALSFYCTIVVCFLGILNRTNSECN